MHSTMHRWALKTLLATGGAVLLLALTACGEPQGAEGQPCRDLVSNPCDAGLTCVAGTCVSLCDGVRCGGYGSCTTKNGAATCACDPGAALFSPTECAPTTPAPCSFAHACREPYRTRCEEVEGQALCRCDLGYLPEPDGTCLPDPLGPCDPNPCAGGLEQYCVVVDAASELTACACSPGYYEDPAGACQPVDPCHPHFCWEPHRSVCELSSPTTGTCRCDPAYTSAAASGPCSPVDPDHPCDGWHFEGDSWEPDECKPLAHAIAVDQERLHSAHPAWDEDWHSFVGQAGHVYSLVVDNLSLPYSSITLYDASGLTALQQTGCRYGSYELSYEIASTATYYAVVAGCYGYSADPPARYRLTLLDSGLDDHGNTTESASALTLGQERGGTLGTLRDKDYFSFGAADEHAYEARVAAGAGTALKLRLLGSAGAELWASDCVSDTEAGGVAWMFHEPQTAYLEVTGCYGWLGDYTVRVDDLGLDDHADLASGGSALTSGVAMAGAITAINEQDWFSFPVNISSATIYQFELVRGTLPAGFFSLALTDGSSEQYRSGCNAANDVPDFRWLFSTSGTYTLMVRGCFGAIGDYTIRYAPQAGSDDHSGDLSQPDSATAVEKGGAAAGGAIHAYNDLDLFKVQVNNGQTATVSLSRGSIPAARLVLDVPGFPATDCSTDTPQSVAYTNNEGQDMLYLFEVRGCDGSLGTYTVQVQ